jgi:hypothetical protein
LKFCTQQEVPKELENQNVDDEDDDKPQKEIKISPIVFHVTFRNLETNT